MLLTTNKSTFELEILEPIPADPDLAQIAHENHLHSADLEQRLANLAEARAVVESRGHWQEYEALAYEYEQIGAMSNAETLRRKAQALRGAR